MDASLPARATRPRRVSGRHAPDSPAHTAICRCSFRRCEAGGRRNPSARSASPPATANAESLPPARRPPSFSTAWQETGPERKTGAGDPASELHESPYPPALNQGLMELGPPNFAHRKDKLRDSLNVASKSGPRVTRPSGTALRNGPPACPESIFTFPERCRRLLRICPRAASHRQRLPPPRWIVCGPMLGTRMTQNDK
jgi:hypothetical protein